MTEKISVEDAINEYYKLKNTYETSYYEKYVKPIVKATKKSKRERRVEFSKLPKAECINCKRNVGSIFLIDSNAIFTRKFVVKCGDNADPCPLNINIISANYRLYENEISMYEKDIDKMKTDIIKEKYNIMFGYIDEATGIDNFSGLSNELKDTTMLAGLQIEKNILINDNPEKNELLAKSIVIFGNDYLLQFKQMVKQYDETGNEASINEAVKFYVNEMMPRLKEIQDLKYEENYVEYDQEKLEYKLYQRKNSLQNLEASDSSESKVVSFVKGLKDTGIVDSGSKAKISGKSKKKKKLEFIIEGEEEEVVGPEGDIDYAPNSPAYNPSSPAYEPNSPAYEPNSPPYNPEPYTIHGDTVIWKDSDYTNVWNGFSQKYKSVLIQDPEWMKKTVNEFVELRKLPANQNISRDFVLPSDIVLPPNINEAKVDLDFGNPVLNDLVARLHPIQRKIIIDAVPKKENPTEEDFKPMLGIMKPMLKPLVDFKAFR